MWGVQVVGRGLTEPLCCCLRTALRSIGAGDFPLRYTAGCAEGKGAFTHCSTPTADVKLPPAQKRSQGSGCLLG